MSDSDQIQADSGDDIGLRCWHCGNKELRVVYTRPRSGGTVLRRRECLGCGQRFSTWERMPHRFSN
jgi:transcriptional regulator NrdR family protein